MCRKFYLSTKKDRGEESALIANALKNLGWVCTFDWTALKDVSPSEYPAVANSEIEGIRQADVVLVLLPGGYGTHAEIGAALALGKPVIIHSPNRQVLETPYPCVFHYHPKVKLIVSAEVDIDAILASLTS